MLGVQDHRHVERVHHDQLGHVAEGHVQEVRGVGEIVARLDEVLVAAAALVPGDDGGELCEQADRLVEVGLRDLGVGIGRADHAHGRPHHIHRMRRQGQVVDDALHQRVERPVRPLQRLELGELRGRR